MNKLQALYGILIIVLLLSLEYIVEFNYVTKQLVRIPLMVIVPFLLLKYSKSDILESLKFRRIRWKDIHISIYAGLVVYFGAIGGYAIIFQFSDPSSITDALTNLSITANNIIYVSIYMSFINVILEEFFFRGFVYMNIKKYNVIIAYLISSFLFAFFHVGIVSAYFEPLIFFSLIVGLMIVGAFLIYINRFGKSLVNSYIVHMFADFAMFSIGYYLFVI